MQAMAASASSLYSAAVPSAQMPPSTPLAATAASPHLAAPPSTRAAGYDRLRSDTIVSNLPQAGAALSLSYPLVEPTPLPPESAALRLRVESGLALSPSSQASLNLTPPTVVTPILTVTAPQPAAVQQEQLPQGVFVSGLPAGPDPVLDETLTPQQGMLLSPRGSADVISLGATPMRSRSLSGGASSEDDTPTPSALGLPRDSNVEDAESWEMSL